MTALQTTAFDYSSLPAGVRREAKAAAARIHQRHAGQVAAIIETGTDLIAIKAKLEHGHFGKWLRAEFDMTERTAQNYMNAAATFKGKSETCFAFAAHHDLRFDLALNPGTVATGNQTAARRRRAPRINGD